MSEFVFAQQSLQLQLLRRRYANVQYAIEMEISVPSTGPRGPEKDFTFTALHGMHTPSYDENSVRRSVCPSVRPSNACMVTKRKKNLSSSSFLTKRMVGGGNPFNLKFWVKLTALERISQFLCFSCGLMTNSDRRV